MWSRLSGRGLVIVLAVAAILAILPTPVPRHIVEVWAAARTAARDGDTLAAAQALADLRQSSAWLPSLGADAVRLALAGGNGDLALKLLEGLASPPAPAADVACWSAQAEALLGRWQEATRRMASADTAGCTATGALLKALARQNIESGELSTATAILDAVASLYPSDVEALSLLGACQAVGDPPEISSALRRAASLGDPLAMELLAAIGSGAEEVSSLLSGAGQVFMQEALWPLAAEAFGRLAWQEPGNSTARAYYGLALDQCGLDGLPELEAAARLDPTSALAQSLLGVHWQLRGHPQEAIRHLEAAVALEPENSAFRASLAAARAEAGDMQSAFADFREAALQRPSDPVFWNLLAAFSINQELELAETALPAARNALILGAEAPDTLDHAGYAHFLLGDRVTAERLLLSALARDPTSAAARLHYGLLLSEAGRIGEARAQLTSAARLGVQGPVGQHAQRALAQLGE